jgi:hypothetical protein
MRNKINTNTTAQEEIRKCLEGKSIYEMTVWTRDHAQYLKWFCNYDEAKLDAIMQTFMGIARFFHTNYNDNAEAIEGFRTFCVECVVKLEIDCR